MPNDFELHAKHNEMITTFRKPPLVELIAELRWLPSGITLKRNNETVLAIEPTLLSPGASDSFFMRFAGLIGAQGFTHSERLYPSGFPTPPHIPVYRYSESGSKPGATLFQLGPGVFSAHITPPYRRWSDFRPYLERGIAALIESRPEKEKELPFTQTLVRYLDCFTDAYTSGAPVREFLEKSLGIKIELPESIESSAADGQPIMPTLQLTVPLKNETTMSLSMGHGKIGDYTGVVMDSAVTARPTTLKPAQPILKDVMKSLDDAHAIISNCFVELTKPLHEMMEIEK